MKYRRLMDRKQISVIIISLVAFLVLTNGVAPSLSLPGVKVFCRVAALPYNSEVVVRMPQKKRIDEYRKDSDFDYQRNSGRSFVDDIMERIAAWLKEIFSDYFKDLKGQDVWDALRYTLLALSGVAVIFVIIKLIGADPKGLFSRSRKGYTSELLSDLDDIESVDFDRLIKEHLRSGDYRTVVRLFYHRSLKELSAVNLIAWKKEKTNRDYCNEIIDSLKNDFRDLTRIFEYTWYGHFNINSEIFNRIEGLFAEFSRSVKEQVQ